VRKLFGVTALAVLAARPVPVEAQARLGAQVSLADDYDVGLGVRVRGDTPRLIPGAPLSVIGSFDWFFPGNNQIYVELNGNLVYNFRIVGSPLRPYVGGGLNIARIDQDLPGGASNDDTALGLNAVGGVNFGTRGRLLPFVELRLEISGGEQLVVAGGVYF
jgi:hypothetical protein